jgi:hypothetical protein
MTYVNVEDCEERRKDIEKSMFGWRNASLVFTLIFMIMGWIYYAFADTAIRQNNKIEGVEKEQSDFRVEQAEMKRDISYIRDCVDEIKKELKKSNGVK